MKKVVFFLAAVALFLWLSLAVQSQSGPLVHRAAVGDSLTVGFWHSQGHSWPAQVGAVNLGVAGYTSNQVLWYEVPTALRTLPRGGWILALMGTNDILLGTPESVLEGNASLIVAEGHENGLKVMLLSIPPATGYVFRPAGFDSQRALYNSWLPTAGADSFCDAGSVPMPFGSDGLHPLDYTPIASEVLECLNAAK